MRSTSFRFGRSHFLLALVLAAAMVPVGHAVAEDALPPPYQLDAVLQEPVTPEGDDRGPALGPPLVMIDLGDADGKPHPASEQFEAMTVVGTRGGITATMTEIVKECRFPCADEQATCHYAATLTLDRPVPELGLPMVAFPGRVELAGWRMVAGTPGAEVPAPELKKGWSDVLWSPEGEHAPQYRVRRIAGEGDGDDAADYVLEGRRKGGEVFEVAGGECRANRHDELTSLSCRGFTALLRKGRPILVSIADYGSPATDLLARFEHGGNTHWLVRLGIKAQTVVGLLVRTQKGWRAVFRPRDYAQIC